MIVNEATVPALLLEKIEGSNIQHRDSRSEAWEEGGAR